MVSCIATFVAICALSVGVFSFPVIEEHQEIGIPETVVGHEEILDHQIGLSQEILEPKHATSYQSFHLESKNSVPVVIKTIHPPTPVKHFSNIGVSAVHQESFGHQQESFGHQQESFGHQQESFGHEIAEIEPVDLKLHHGI